MILQADVAFACTAESWELLEFAFLDKILPAIITKAELVVDHSVHAHFATTWGDTQEELIPLSGWTSRIWHFRLTGPSHRVGLKHLIQPTCFLRIVPVDIVLDLNFWPTLPRGRVVFGDVEHKSAIATLGNVVVERKLKVLVFFIGDDVTGIVPFANNRSIDDFPTFGQSVFLVVAPSIGRRAIEQKLPACDRLGAGQLIGWLFCMKSLDR